MDPHRVLIILPSSGRDFVPVTLVSSSDLESGTESEEEYVDALETPELVLPASADLGVSTENVGYTFN
jgi:hypothetical protein